MDYNQPDNSGSLSGFWINVIYISIIAGINGLTFISNNIGFIYKGVVGALTIFALLLNIIKHWKDLKKRSNNFKDMC